MIAAMTFFLILLALSTAVALWGLRLIESDDRGHRPPPASHPVDERFLPPALHR
jgi:hypothetical protein